MITGTRCRAGLMMAVALMAAPALAGPDLVEFPKDYQTQFIVYNTIERPDRTPNQIRFMYVNPAAHRAASASRPAPSGTVLVMEDRAAKLGADGQPERDAAGRMVPTDRVLAIAVMEKRTGWGAGYNAERRNGEWEYAGFAPDGTRRTTTEAQTASCFACHQSRATRDWTFTYVKFLQDSGR
ncbi:MAG: hypothetical protein EAZ99_13630 [Alphaproteobacteria bacterium]|nr:MAG: hypothetical protein EAZ99_13630 [Alphaproteobacteria bacterium]